MTEHTHNGPDSQQVTHNHRGDEVAHGHSDLKPWHAWTWRPAEVAEAATETVRLAIEVTVPAGTDHQDVAVAINRALDEDSETGLNWGDWTVSAAEVEPAHTITWDFEELAGHPVTSAEAHQIAKIIDYTSAGEIIRDVVGQVVRLTDDDDD